MEGRKGRELVRPETAQPLVRQYLDRRGCLPSLPLFGLMRHVSRSHDRELVWQMKAPTSWVPLVSQPALGRSLFSFLTFVFGVPHLVFQSTGITAARYYVCLLFHSSNSFCTRSERSLLGSRSSHRLAAAFRVSLRTNTVSLSKSGSLLLPAGLPTLPAGTRMAIK